MARKKGFDDLMEAVAFAEAGETETARRIASEIFPPPAEEGPRILAVSGAPGFSAGMIEKAIGVAERLEYGLIALSVAPAFARLVSRLGARPRRGGGYLPADVFRARAAERGIPFVHAVRSGDPVAAAADVSRTFRRVAFLLVERDLAPRSRFTAVEIPVFYLIRG